MIRKTAVGQDLKSASRVLAATLQDPSDQQGLSSFHHDSGAADHSRRPDRSEHFDGAAFSPPANAGQAVPLQPSPA